jgi:hypothetical protein
MPSGPKHAKVREDTFVDISATKLRGLRVPGRGEFTAPSLVGHLWKHMLGSHAPLTKLVGDCQEKLWPESDANAVRAKLIGHLVGHTLHEVVESLHRADEQKVLRISRLPEARKVALLSEATRIAEGRLRTVGSLEGMLAAHPTGCQLLLYCSRMCCHRETAAQQPGAPRPSRQHSRGEESKARGEKHETEAAEWARWRWPPPRFKVLTHVFVVSGGGTESSPPARRIKAEFDALVLDVDEQIVAVVEAKAGSGLYADLPKLLKARETLLTPSTPIRVRIGTRGASPRTLWTAEGAPPHICYVFGAVGELEEIADRSVQLALAHTLLDAALAKGAGGVLRDGQLVRDAGALIHTEMVSELSTTTNSRSSIHVTYDAEHVAGLQASLQTHLDCFQATLNELCESGTASFWSRAPPSSSGSKKTALGYNIWRTTEHGSSSSVVGARRREGTE